MEELVRLLAQQPHCSTETQRTLVETQYEEQQAAQQQQAALLEDLLRAELIPRKLDEIFPIQKSDFLEKSAQTQRIRKSRR
ncbi:hypothetical protein UY3_06037 [Chelonia mydas]|uniref:Uncharacterized protein n=1 Tax=Chelonia mydas TaxID=8469 RepID=M7BHT8_CHEMY|nr:hypothetical protein UY3_06037 [Chelonia mydas]